MNGNDKTKIAFVCVENAGRSQMASAFARREIEVRNMDIEIVTGGTEPANHIHPNVVKVMKEKGIDISDREPRKITISDLGDCDYTITMGCSAEEVCPATWNGESRDWDLDDPGESDLDRTRKIRDIIEKKVNNFLNELEG